MPILTNLELPNFRQQYQLENKKIVLVGGCFDVLHKGHILFLEKAKEQGEVLVVLLESDLRIKELKGAHRPLHLQSDRALVLNALRSVDFVICLPSVMRDSDYEKIIFQISPQVIATTKGDSQIHHKTRIADLVAAQVVEVMELAEEYSTSAILEKISSTDSP
ncbi:hypothetical protein A2631_04865 [Candidatus Daviesbacteria bacterium RIFCSPHIGHO2_01_FULL_44_29]|uniref:Cytidyltransferase-like domain-containing protein n=1 Tax=Candidatus Daviesbacteria bacterium RIFCSPHIGHO2_02_FULL_43_12 TaxID=1797776 RepID=A0A1F5KGH9_9BACT|nr:MAG: hypothetical protein A2631_04865 [Candidatus Daviesbacteria bacterium RIFCSPHIGHO2_01_FULL_44_29]OGE40053.1 MAG: hypothetical protein A3D25_04595 [Candidatus Daviesbacteria bacterium RIFCSPHIGHO2_02_FULL_43_12]OGE41465.1 MAG: hypothetical protein A3E86_05215 [Candidatus Daviesbacteria bacterium RIFCSPHIGHO2_12_FULL_47_45]OGE70267.1 MAG: hypothetical protein A3B55_00975 [Candidatus Daviesbacteria bacterium RIFCSPLOWO2_01_FULL_43_15]